MDIYSILSSARHSPLALGHLPQPVPNDLPRGSDPNVFTFQDAFEDLLVASNGHQLPDIKTRYHQCQLLRSMFPNGEPPWFWLRRLESQGLVSSRSRFPPNPFPLLQTHHQHEPDYFPFHEHEESPRHPADPWVNTFEKSLETHDPAPGSIFEKVKKAIADMERGLFGDQTPKHDTRPAEEKPQKDQAGAPRNFDGLFSEISSAFEETQSSWDTFLKHVVGQGGSGDVDNSKKASRFTTENFEKKDGGETVEKEHVDQFGYLHKTVTRKILDAEGREVGLETYVAIRPADKNSKNGDRGGSLSNEQSVSLSEKDKGSSWFWR